MNIKMAPAVFFGNTQRIPELHKVPGFYLLSFT